MFELMGIYAALTGALTVVALLLLRRWSEAIGLVDHPGGRKRHEHVTPVVGGIGLGIGLLPLGLAFNHFGLLLICWGLTSLALLVLGTIDDIVESSSSQRLVLHLLAGMALLPAGLGISHLGNLFGDDLFMLGWSGVLLTVFAVAAAINAYNMIDGLDGLLALVALVPLMLLTAIAADEGLAWEATLGAALSAGLLAFSLFNVRFPWVGRASIFMGDAGSTLVGFTIAWLAISVAMRGVMPPVVALYLIMLPLMDTAGVIWRRRVRRVSAATPGRDHLHHILLDLGMSVRTTVFFIAALNLLMAAFGLLMWYLSVHEGLMLMVFFTITLIYCMGTRVPSKIKRRIRQLKQSQFRI